MKAKVTRQAPPAENKDIVSLDFTPYAPKILLVDDNAVNRKVSGEILRNAGCVVVPAESGKEAIELVQKHDFALIFMDIQMPDMDGIATTKAIRASAVKSLPPIVAMTAYSMQGDREKFLAAGLDDYVPKPIRARTLLNKVAALLGIQHSNSDKKDAQNENNLKVINFDVLKELEKYGGESLVYASLSDFRDETEELIQSAMESFKKQEFENILSKLHTLKGNASTLGVDRVAACARQIEDKLKKNKQVTLAQDLLSLKQYFLEFKDHLSKTYKSNSNHDVR